MLRNPQLLLARILWIVPLALAALSIHQVRVAAGLSETLAEGTPAIAQVVRYERSDRKDVTQAELDLHIVLPDGSIFDRDRLALPYSIAHRVEQDSVDVRVLEGGHPPVVLTAIVGTQRRIALSNAGMGMIAMMMAFAGVFFWTRMLKRQGDPSARRTGGPLKSS